MKTKILHLESYDDLHSIKDKISWGTGEQVVLIWPIRGQLVHTKLDLLLIQRHVQNIGSKLALVTKNNRVREFASQLDIPVFRSLRQANTLPWEYTVKDPQTQRPKIKQPKDLQKLREAAHPPPISSWTNHPTSRIIAFILGVLASLTLLAFLLPRAEITLSPKTETQELTLTITANPALLSYNLSGAVPAQRISVIVEGRDSIRPSGEIGIPQQPAAGEAEFINLTDQPISIPKGTIVRTLDSPPIKFVTTANGVLSASPGEFITIPITALNPGLESNLPAESLTVIEGGLGLYLTVTNPAPTTGGTEQISAAPEPEDYDKLLDDLLESLWDTALEEAEKGLALNDIILDQYPQTVTILEETFNPPEPQPTSELSLILRVEYELSVVSGETFHDMVNAILDATLPQGHSVMQGTLIITRNSDFAFQENNTFTWEISAQRGIFSLKDKHAVIQSILGQSPDQAARTLSQNLSLNTTPEITITPSWWPWLPFLELQITVRDQ